MIPFYSLRKNSPAGCWEGQVHCREGGAGEAGSNYSRRGWIIRRHAHLAGAAGVWSRSDRAPSSGGREGYCPDARRREEHHLPPRRREGRKPEPAAECWPIRNSCDKNNKTKANSVFVLYTNWKRIMLSSRWFWAFSSWLSVFCRVSSCSSSLFTRSRPSQLSMVFVF